MKKLGESDPGKRGIAAQDSRPRRLSGSMMMGWDGMGGKRRKGKGKRGRVTWGREEKRKGQLVVDGNGFGSAKLTLPTSYSARPRGRGCEGFADASGAKDSVLISALLEGWQQQQQLILD